MRIAYVEDNHTNLALVERILRVTTHEVVSYTEGEDALAGIRREPFDLILMDVELAGEMGGLEVVRLLRQDGLKTPIVAVTAYAMMGDRDRMIVAGCDDYLPKPLPIREFMDLIARFEARLAPPPPPEPALAVSVAPPATPPSANGAHAHPTQAEAPKPISAAQLARVVRHFQPLTNIKP
jgi:CheY-like chemotaxis protein